jgi:hypothetical protein
MGLMNGAGTVSQAIKFQLTNTIQSLNDQAMHTSLVDWLHAWLFIPENKL